MKKKLLYGMAAVMAVVLIISIGMVVRQEMQYQQSAASYEEAAYIARFEPEKPMPPPSAAVGKEEPVETKDPVEAVLEEIDLAALQGVNADVAGWIYIPGTELSYPLLCGPDNQYYLNHTWNRVSNSGGAIFLDCRCAPDFTDFNTIIYGHRMGNDSMFGTLKYYGKQEFWQDHSEIYLLDRSGVHVYDIFAAWEASVTSDAYVVNPSGEEGRQRFFAASAGGNCLDTGAAPGLEAKVLTLSTCTADGSRTSRWIVQAVERTK